MTNQSTTTKEALEPCPFCGIVPARRDNVYRYDSIAEHAEGSYCPIANTTIGINSWNSRASAPIAPVVDDESASPDYQKGFEAGCVFTVAALEDNLWHVNHVFDGMECCKRCALVKPAEGWTRPCKGPHELSLRADAASASTVAPQQSDDDDQPQNHAATCDRWVRCGDHVHYESIVNCSCGAPASPAALRNEAEVYVDYERDPVTGEVFTVNKPCAPPSTLAKAAAAEIANWLNWKGDVHPAAHQQNIVSIAAIIERCLAGGSESVKPN